MSRIRPQFATALLSTALGLAGLCNAAEPAVTPPVVQDTNRATTAKWNLAVFPSGDEFRLELAISDRERALGYMYRERIGAQEAMLFFFEEPGLHGIWMRNCRVALDLIWLDESHHVVHIVASAPPCTADDECPSYTPMRNAFYVLEVAGGTVERTGLAAGDRVQLIELGSRGG